MTDKSKKLKQQEQENWSWDDDVESAEILKQDEQSRGNVFANVGRQSLALGLFVAMVIGIVAFWAINGADATSALIGGGFGLLIFLVPLFLIRWSRRG